MKIDPKSLTPEQHQRLFDELRQDKEFLKTRNIMLAVTVIGGIMLFGAGWMMMNKKLDLLDVISLSVAFVFANSYFVRRLSAMQKVVLERWQKEAEEQARRDALLNPPDSEQDQASG